MTGAVDQRRRALHAPVAAPFTPEQEARLREILRDELKALLNVLAQPIEDYRLLTVSGPPLGEFIRSEMERRDEDLREGWKQQQRAFNAWLREDSSTAHLAKDG